MNDDECDECCEEHNFDLFAHIYVLAIGVSDAKLKNFTNKINKVK